jgi:hypothetical protein
MDFREMKAAWEPERKRIIKDLTAILQRSAARRESSHGSTPLLTGIRQRANWFQRIEFPEHDIATTDPVDCAVYDGADDNTLGVLNADDASRLRPYPKWLGMEPLIPDLHGKSVLEIGSCAGFFSLEFARLGARSVMGIEPVPYWRKQALWAAEVLGCEQRVAFREGDLLHSTDIPRHDVVFMSSVLDHLHFPMLGIYRLLMLAREFVLLDTHVRSTDQALITLQLINGGTAHSFTFSHPAIVQFLSRCNVRPENIQAHHYGFVGDYHRVLYVIRTTGEEDATPRPPADEAVKHYGTKHANQPGRPIGGRGLARWLRHFTTAATR